MSHGKVLGGLVVSCHDICVTQYNIVAYKPNTLFYISEKRSQAASVALKPALAKPALAKVKHSGLCSLCL